MHARYERAVDGRIGEVVADRYRIEAVIGMGGAGVLYRACHVRTGREVALKMLHSRSSDAPIARLRLEREAFATVNLRHPHVVEVLDLGEDREGTPFLAMELLHGVSLAERIERDGPLTVQETFELALPLLGVLALAHARGVLHRDLKPGNVFLAEMPDGRVLPKLLDFGIAKVEGGAALTQPGKLIGTVGFMSPEHVHGGELTPASDLWSFAALLYVCLVGHPPYSGAAIAGAEPPRFPDPALAHADAVALLSVIERGLEWNPSARFGAAHGFARALLAMAHQRGLSIPEAPDPLGLPDFRAWCAELVGAPQTFALSRGHTREVPGSLQPSAAASRSSVSDVHPAVLPQIGRTLADRFLLRRAIGRGAMGAVYEAEDQKTQQVIALKFLHRLEPGAIYRLKREFRSLADIAHPNLVALHELFADEHGRYFFSLDLVRGEAFLEHVRGPSGGRDFDEARLRAALVQLARGVRHLHASGQLHRDLKPSNVLVTPDGRLSIVDFGLAHSLFDADAEQSEHEFLGTPAYAAPEQVDPRRTAQASDWYAVGVMLYEALCGVPPFAGNSHQMMQQKAREEPAPPSTRCRRPLPRDLERICMRLLAIDPALRASGSDLLSVLDASDQGSENEAQLVFAGRQTELTQLEDAFVRARKGTLSAVFVSAPSGMGKTTLVEHFLRRLRTSQRALVLRGRCYAQEALHYKAFDGVVDALSAYLRQLSGDTALALLPEDKAALAQLFPVLRRVEPISRAAFVAPPIEEQGLRTRAFAALRELFANVASHAPVVVFIDDLQWGDVDSARLLRALLAAPPIPGLLIVAAFRNESRASAPLFGELFRDGGPGTRCMQIVLGPLLATQVEELAGRLLDGALSAEASRSIARKSEGHPMLAAELIRFARDRDDLARLDELSLQAAIEAQLTRLSLGARQVLELLCIAGQRLPRTLVFKLVPTASLAAVRELRLSRALRESVVEDELQLEPYHDQVREVALGQIEPKAARALHSLLADALRERGDVQLEAVVHHCLNAGRAGEAAVLAERASARASEALAFDRAADLLELALQYAREPGEQRRLRIAVADASVRAGRALRAAQSYDAVARELEQTNEESERFELRRRAMTQYFVGGHCTQGTRLLHQLAGELGLRLEQARPDKLWTLFTFGVSLLWLTFTGLPRLRKRARVETPELTRQRAHLRLLWSAAAPLVHVNSFDAGMFTWRAFVLAAKLGEPVIYGQALALRMTGFAFLASTRWRAFDRRVAYARELVRRSSEAWDLRFVSVMQGAQALLFGEFDRTIETCLQAATSIESRTPFALAVQSTARAAVIPALFWRGRVARIAELSEPWIKDAEAAGDRHLQVNFRILGAHRFLREDDPARARAEIEFARQIELDYLHPVFCGPWWEAGILLYEGRAREALEVCEQQRAGFEVTTRGSRAYRAGWALTLGNVAGALLEQDPTDARARATLATALATVRGMRIPFGAAAYAHARAVQARYAPDGPDLESARRELETAIAGYDALGMRLYAASARLALVDLGDPHADAVERSALETFAAEGIEKPRRFARLFASGLVRAER